jgi:hypothetical protein
VTDIQQVLREAASTGEIVEIVYFGGTQPGARRDIHPRSVDPPYVRAMCLENRAYRTFRTDRMVLADGAYRFLPKYDPAGGAPPPVTFPDFLRRFDELGFAAGIHAEVLEDGVRLYGTRPAGDRAGVPSASLVRAASGRYVVTAADVGRTSTANLSEAILTLADGLQLDADVLAHLMMPPVGASVPSALPPPLPAPKATRRPWWWWPALAMIGLGLVRLWVEASRWLSAWPG